LALPGTEYLGDLRRCFERREKRREKKKEDASTSIYNSVETRVGCHHMMTRRESRRRNMRGRRKIVDSAKRTQKTVSGMYERKSEKGI